MSNGMISFGAKLKQHAHLPAERAGGHLRRRDHHLRRSCTGARTASRAAWRPGVKAGDLVTVGLPNSVGFVEACYGIWKLGATPQPVSFRLPKGELQAIIDLAKAPLVVAEFEHERQPAGDDRGRDRWPCRTTTATCPTPIPADLQGADQRRLDRAAEADPGRPAGPDAGGDAGGRRLPPEARTTRVLIPAPLYHNAPVRHDDGGTALGAHLVLTPRFDPEGTLADGRARTRRPGSTWCRP